MIEVHGLWVMRRVYAGSHDWNDSATYYNCAPRLSPCSVHDSLTRAVTAEVAKFKVRAPTAVSPSVFLFALSLTLVAALIIAEVITRRYAPSRLAPRRALTHPHRRARAAEGEAYARLSSGASAGAARRRSYADGGSVFSDEDIELSVFTPSHAHTRRRREHDHDVPRL